MIYAIKKIIKKMGQSISPKDVIAIDRIVSADHEFEGKNVFISGGSGGIGLAIARLLLESGANVVLGGTNQEKLDSCVRDLGYDGRVSSVVIDLLDIAGVESAVAAVTSCYGGVDILIVSSGVHTENVDLWSMTPEEYDRVMAVNLKGSFFLAREVAKQMIALNKKGHILFVGSSRGFEPAWSPYGISKWGLRGLTEGLAQILMPYGIVVNGIAPGSTATSLIGVSDGDSIASGENGAGRLVMPAEVASWAKMLVGAPGDMVIGETVLVSAGRGRIDVR